MLAVYYGPIDQWHQYTFQAALLNNLGTSAYWNTIKTNYYYQASTNSEGFWRDELAIFSL
jgi:hypothetical protein